MQKKWKKLFAVLTVTTLVTGTLWGCGGKEEQSVTKTEVVNGIEGVGDSSPVTITAVMKDMSADDEVSLKFLEQVSKRVSEQVGREVTIQLAPISDGTYSESMSLLLQSGVIPDLIYFQGGDYQFAITQEILEDLTSYIEHSTYVRAMMQPFNHERIENYPYLLWLSPDRIKVPVVRKDWLEELEAGQVLLDNPTTENYKTFFKELKSNYNLKAALTIPGDIAELDTIFNPAFGVTQTWLKQGDSYVYCKVSEAEKHKLEYYAELYQDGLLDNEWLTMKWDTKESAFYNGEVGVICGTQGSVTNIYNTKMTGQNGEAAELVVLPPAQGVVQSYLPSDVSKESRGWAISAYSENKEIAFAILEYMASPEGQVLDKLGYEGEHYNLENGQYVLTDKIVEWYPRFHESIITMDADISENTPYFSAAALQSLDMVSKYSTLDNAFVLPDDYVTNWDAGESLYAEFAADMISGKKTGADFDAFIQEWNSLGGAEITEYANSILSE